MSRFITRIFHKGEDLAPTIRLSDGEEVSLLGKTISLEFNLSEKFCIGWYDIAARQGYPCPDSARTDKKFEACLACQKRTGFNPAFYHAATISPQQEALNAEPHSLYLAYMGKDYVKVGISRSRRGIQRLLDQGARAGLVLQTFPTALIARQYEARIARLSGVNETTSTRTKLALLNQPFSEIIAREQLLAVKQRCEQELSVSLSDEVLLFDKFYSHKEPALNISKVTAMTEPKISGEAEAVVGDILITRYDDRFLAMPLKQRLGYQVQITDQLLSLSLEPEQMQLF